MPSRPNPASEELALVLREAMMPCPAVTAPARSDDRAEVFVEAVMLEAPTAVAAAVNIDSVTLLANEPRVRLLGTPQIVARVDERSTLTIAEASGALSTPILHQVSLTPTLAEPDFTVLDLEILLQLPAGPGTRGPGATKLSMKMAPREGHTVVRSALLAHHPALSLIALVTSRRIRNEESLRAIFECKMMRRRQSSGRSSFEPSPTPLARQ